MTDPEGPLDLSRVIRDCAWVFVEARRRLGDEWFIEAGTLSFEITERGDVLLHTGKGISVCYGIDESAEHLLAIDRNQEPAFLSLIHPDGQLEELGPVDLDDAESP